MKIGRKKRKANKDEDKNVKEEGEKEFPAKKKKNKKSQ